MREKERYLVCVKVTINQFELLNVSHTEIYLDLVRCHLKKICDNF